MLQDPHDDNVVPIVQELRRRLPQVNSISPGQGEDEEKLEVQNDLETSLENGTITSSMTLLSCLYTSSTCFMFFFELFVYSVEIF